MKATKKAEIIKKLIPLLTDNLEYIFPIKVHVFFKNAFSNNQYIVSQFSNTNDAQKVMCEKNQPYRQPAHVFVLHAVIFLKGRNSLAITYRNYFISSLDNKDEKKILIPMLCLVAIAVHASQPCSSTWL
jgi:hypothetical protein